LPNPTLTSSLSLSLSSLLILQLRNERSVNFGKTRGRFIGNFGVNFCAKPFVDISMDSLVRLTLIFDITCREVIGELVSDDINQETCAKKDKRCEVFKDMPQQCHSPQGTRRCFASK